MSSREERLLKNKERLKIKHLERKVLEKGSEEELELKRKHQECNNEQKRKLTSMYLKIMMSIEDPLRIAYNKTPRNTYESLDREDKIKIISCKDGLVEGVYRAIHNNGKLPQWMNIIIPYDREASSIVYVYTKNGWVEKRYIDVVDGQMIQYDDCVKYLLLQLLETKKEEDERNAK